MTPYSYTPTKDRKNRPSCWIRVNDLGTQGGGLNEGIVLVKHEQKGHILWVEKRLDGKTIEGGIAMHEIEVMERLAEFKHPYIVQIKDWYIDPERKLGSIFMEYCDLGSMDALIKRHIQAGRRPIGEHYIWRWFTQLSQALAFCHFGPDYNDPKEFMAWNTIFHRGE